MGGHRLMTIIDLILGGIISLVVGAAVFILFFDRDPERPIPLEPRVIVSPADGVIVYVRRIDGNAIPWSEKGGKRINLVELTKFDYGISDGAILGIYMSPFVVHVNRSPIAGQVTHILRSPGKTMRMRNPVFEFENRRTTIALRHASGFQTIVIQIGVFAIARIDTFVSEGAKVKLGERIGRVRMGSQVDLIIPQMPDLDILVKEGDRVFAGSSIIARF